MTPSGEMDQPPRNSHTNEVRISSKEFSGEAKFHSHVLRATTDSEHHQELVYTDVSQQWGGNVVTFLNEEAEETKHYNSRTYVFWVRVMPVELHDCHQIWYHNQEDSCRESGLLTLAEKRHLRALVGTTIDFLHPSYAGSRKEPDLLIRADNLRLPTVVMESGWCESWPRLRDDMNLWLIGDNEAAMAVLLLKWQSIGNTNRVIGFVELFSLDHNEILRLRQTEVVFPAPTQTPGPQQIRLTRRALFSPTVFPGPEGSIFS